MSAGALLYLLLLVYRRAGKVHTEAAEEGLGSCWLGWFDEGAAKKCLGLPRAKKVDLLICLGHAADSPRPKIRRSLDEIRRYA